MKQVYVEIEGRSPLMMNRFMETALEGTTTLVRSKKDPHHVAESKIYRGTDGEPCLPSNNLYRCLIDAGTFITYRGKMKLTTAKGSLISAGLSIVETELKLLPLRGKKLDWKIDSRSVVIPSTQGRIMAYRPIFEEYKICFTLEYDEELFGLDTIQQLFDYAGRRVGLGDYRPSRKGPFGKFCLTRFEPEEVEALEKVTEKSKKKK